VHGNFIVNTGGAQTSEILALVEEIRDKARQERGIEMEMEVKIIGEDEATF
jgi:UDP-N-acetylenolpyruvoylglucosamine reductase